MQIRNRILECFERASMPGIHPDERDRLLSFVVVGGGPTSCEFTGELHDFVTSDVSKWYPELKDHIKIHLVEAGAVSEIVLILPVSLTHYNRNY